MAILIDTPRWPAHGTVFAHLVSDVSLAELHDFARAAGLPSRAFDHDHYDVPASRHAELVGRLVGSGLRTRTPERTPKRSAARAALVERWDALAPSDPGFGLELIERWSSPNRHYHDVRHLLAMLEALDTLDAADELSLFAAWFHDAVYEGRPGEDEQESARLAEGALPLLGLTDPEVDEVARLIRLTATHDPAPRDAVGAAFVDADLSILGASQGRYHVYVRDIRLEWEHLGEAEFAAGRTAFLQRMLGRERIFRTDAGRDTWEQNARTNIADELRHWFPETP